MPAYKDSPVTQEWETRAKNLLKGELKRRGVTYAQLAEKLSAEIGRWKQLVATTSGCWCLPGSEGPSARAPISNISTLRVAPTPD